MLTYDPTKPVENPYETLLRTQSLGQMFSPGMLGNPAADALKEQGLKAMAANWKPTEAPPSIPASASWMKGSTLPAQAPTAPKLGFGGYGGGPTVQALRQSPEFMDQLKTGLSAQGPGFMLPKGPSGASGLHGGTQPAFGKAAPSGQAPRPAPTFSSGGAAVPRNRLAFGTGSRSNVVQRPGFTPSGPSSWRNF